ncbi:MAG: hypothetical protein B1H04_05855 [Planctomycetales bacterium 4484_123]|nr:MAG: hypothetical protein B1H04_05855 [Planctomycetales bacterium 4484_123]
MTGSPNNPSTRIPAGPLPRGFTLMEMTVSLLVVSVLMVSITSAVILAGRAVPSSDSPTAAIVSASAALEQMAGELQYALSFTERSGNAIEFTMPDRNGNGQPDLIRYAWSGLPGAPLTRQCDGGEAATFVEHVYHFQADCELKTVVEAGPNEQESAEMLLVSHDDSGGQAEARLVQADNWPGQYFRPILPPGAVGWRITQVRFKAMQAGSVDGLLLVQLRTADGSAKPTDTILAQNILRESDLTNTYIWQEFSFSGMPRLSPTTGVCLLLVHVAGEGAAWTRYEYKGADTPDAHCVYTTDGGSSWNIDTARDMLFYIYGTVITTDAAASATRYYVTKVNLSLQSSPQDSARVRTGVQVLSQPEVTGDVSD